MCLESAHRYQQNDVIVLGQKFSVSEIYWKFWFLKTIRKMKILKPRVNIFTLKFIWMIIINEWILNTFFWIIGKNLTKNSAQQLFIFLNQKFAVLVFNLLEVIGCFWLRQTESTNFLNQSHRFDDTQNEKLFNSFCDERTCH